VVLITTIQTLLDRERQSNKELSQPLVDLQKIHTDKDFTILPSIKDPGPGVEGCLDCGCAMVGIMEARTRKIVWVCRDIISALKLASLVQTNPGVVRTYLKVKYIDDLPIVVSQSMPLYEAEKQIAAGLMEIDADEDLIIHDLTHDPLTHCPGVNCRSKQHFLCFPGCNDLVKVSI